MPTIAGPEENPICLETVTLTGDGCPDAIAFEWSLVSSPNGATVSIASPTSLTTTVTYDVEGIYKFQLCCFFEIEADDFGDV